jgi:hypothetical protein
MSTRTHGARPAQASEMSGPPPFVVCPSLVTATSRSAHVAPVRANSSREAHTPPARSEYVATTENSPSAFSTHAPCTRSSRRCANSRNSFSRSLRTPARRTPGLSITERLRDDSDEHDDREDDAAGASVV